VPLSVDPAAQPREPAGAGRRRDDQLPRRGAAASGQRRLQREQLGVRRLAVVVGCRVHAQLLTRDLEVDRVAGHDVPGGRVALYGHLGPDRAALEVDDVDAAELELRPRRPRVLGDPGTHGLAEAGVLAVLEVHVLLGVRRAVQLLAAGRPGVERAGTPGHAVELAADPVPDDAADVVVHAEHL